MNSSLLLRSPCLSLLMGSFSSSLKAKADRRPQILKLFTLVKYKSWGCRVILPLRPNHPVLLDPYQMPENMIYCFLQPRKQILVLVLFLPQLKASKVEHMARSDRMSYSTSTVLGLSCAHTQGGNNISLSNLYLHGNNRGGYLDGMFCRHGKESRKFS